MNPEVERLILLQDLELMIEELGDTKKLKAEKQLGFELGDPSMLTVAREELAESVDPGLLKKYERLRTRFPRAIVPVKDGICFGCFVRRPAKASVSEDGADPIEFCERCKRIIFRYSVS